MYRLPADPLGPAARLWAGLDKPWQEAFRQAWEALRSGNMADLVRELEEGGEAERSAAMEVNEALGYLWPRLQELAEVMPAS